jgi:hypothetical protein
VAKGAAARSVASLASPADDGACPSLAGGGEFVVWLRIAAGLLAPAVVVFGRNRGDTFLSDDYVYSDRRRSGLATLPRSVTVASFADVV